MQEQTEEKKSEFESHAESTAIESLSKHCAIAWCTETTKLHPKPEDLNATQDKIFYQLQQRKNLSKNSLRCIIQTQEKGHLSIL